MGDIQYENIPYRISEIEQEYGKNVHILSDPYLMSLLAILCSPETKQPLINHLVEAIYTHLVKAAINGSFPRRRVEIASRMAEFHPEAGVYAGEIIDPGTKVVSVNLARAGTFPSHICYSAFNHFLNPDGVRQDHIIAARQSDSSGKVTGTTFSGSKVGGPVDGRIVIFPDPMGATGGTIEEAVDYYQTQIEGTPTKFIALHLIVTPEYLKKVQALSAKGTEIEIYSVRLDRGLSSPEVLREVPGKLWDQERGLNDQHYIVPGGGGFGEILNNAFV